MRACVCLCVRSQDTTTDARIINKLLERQTPGIKWIHDFEFKHVKHRHLDFEDRKLRGPRMFRNNQEQSLATITRKLVNKGDQQLVSRGG